MSVRILITQGVLSLAETVILDRLFFSFLSPKPGAARGRYAAGMAAYFVFQLVTYVLGCPLFSTAVLYLAFTLLLAMGFFVDNFQIKAIVSFLFVVLNYAGKVLAAYSVFQYVYHQRMPPLPRLLILDPMTQITACAYFLIFVAVMLGFRRFRVGNKIVLYNFMAFLAPTGTLFITAKLFGHSVQRNTDLLYLDVGGLLFCTSIALFYLLDKTVVLDETSEKSAMFQQMLAMEEDYYKKLVASLREVQAIRHDMKNHMHCVSSLLDMGRHADAKRYITGIYQSAAATSTLCSSGNTIIDILVNQKLSGASRQGFTPSVNVVAPPELAVEPVDLCILLGNLLDNALEACARMQGEEQKKISVFAQVSQGILCVRITNTYDGRLIFENDGYRSIKAGEKFCGIGLSNVYKVARKYDGKCTVAHDESTFTVTVLLPLPA